MDNFRQVFEPIVRQYNRLLYDPYMVDVTQYKGGSSVGTDWVSRHLQTHLHHVKERFFGLQRRFKEVELTDLLEDNWFRLLVLNGLDRVATIRQANPALRLKFYKPNSNSFAFTEVTSGGIFSGWFRGALVNVAQFSAVAFPALYLSNTVDFGLGKFVSFLGWYTFFDALLFPLDKIKTLLYADTRKEYKSNRGRNVDFQVFSEVNNNLGAAYRGVASKLVFNVPWAWAIYNSVNDVSDINKILSWATVALLYPLNGSKTVSQLAGTAISTPNFSAALPTGLYRGFVPFALANALGLLTFHNLSGKSRQQSYTNAFSEDILYYNQKHHYPPAEIL